MTYTAFLKMLPMAVAAVLLAIAGFTIYIRAKHVTRSEFVKLFKTANYLQAWVLVVAIVLTASYGIFAHLKAKQSVQAVVALNYSEASMALNSNGTRYNMAEITCDEVLERAIDKGGLKDEVSVKELKKCLSVYPYVQGDVQDESEYHISTEFVVEYHASKDTQHLDAENMIKLITSAYKDYYIENYTDNFTVPTGEDHPDFANMEYMDVVSFFEKEATSILNYLYGMAEKNSSFVTSKNTTFNSIAGEVHQFKETQIEQNLKSLILQYGIVRDKTGYIDRLSYQNTNTDFERQKNAVSFSLCNQAIAMYSEEMTRVVLVPTWDEVGKYYMGRTKVGIDELSVMATDFSDKVAANEKSIMENNLIIGKMQGAPGNSASHEAADALIGEIDKQLHAFADDAIAAGREFWSHRMNQCIAVSISGVTLMGELKGLIVFAAFAYAALMLYAISKKFPKKGTGIER
ncbi:MAG: hypothetical protein IJC78_03720 [Clostridia bacterium]|nr:hypothetical protein [Clostridia bacterium]